MAFTSRAGLAAGLMSGFFAEGLCLLTLLGSEEVAAAENFFTESATLATVGL